MKTLKLLFITLVLVSCSASLKTINDTENKYKLTTEKDLQLPDYVKKIDAFYNSGNEGSFIGEKNVKIYYKIFKQKFNEKGAIVISSGRTEAAIKYKELIYDLYNNGYSIYIHDHRGQGLSGRMLENHDMGYVSNFQYYIDDLKTFYNNYVTKDKHKNIFLMTHSMGGAIGMTYLEQYPTDFKAAVFSSPMLGLPPPTCTAVNVLESKNPKYVMGGTDYQDDSVKFEDNTLTHSEIRYKRMLKAFNETTDARLGSATYQWVVNSCKQFKYIFDNADKIQTPLLLFSGEDEKIVDPNSHKEFIYKLKKLKKDANGYFVPNAMHELYIEKDKARINVLTTILDFFESFEPNYKLHNIWAVIEYDGKELNKKDYAKGLPIFEINTTKSRVMGNDGCNTFNGEIEINKSSIKFSKIISTKMGCQNNLNIIKTIRNKELNYKFEKNSLFMYLDGKLIMVLKNID